MKCLIVIILFLITPFLFSFAQENPASMKLLEFEKTSILEFTNNGEIPIDSIVLWVDDGYSFTSFKTESDWYGKKISSGMLLINSTETLQKDQSLKIGVKTKHEDTEIKWRLNDDNNESIMVGTTFVTVSRNEINDLKGILENSNFRVIPDNVTAGSKVRVIGYDFGPNQNLGLYVDSQKIHGFKADSSGSFVFTSKVPENIEPGNVKFSITDQTNATVFTDVVVKTPDFKRNIKKIPLILESVSSLIEPGDTILFSGKATPYRQITLSITQPDSTKLINKTIASSSGDWSLNFTTTENLTFGNYIARISDSKTSIPKIISVSVPNPLTLESDKKIFKKSEILAFNVTANPNQPLKVFLVDSNANQIKSFTSNIPEDGIAAVEFNPDYLSKGYYSLFVFQNQLSDSVAFGIESYPKNELTFKLDKTNYRNNELATLSILGKPNNHLDLLIVDSAQNTIFEDSIILNQEGKKTYTISLEQFLKDSYSIVLSKGNIKQTETFTVGFSYGSTVFDINFGQTNLEPGDVIQFFGQTTPYTALDIFLVDPTGKIIRNIESFSKHNGEFFHKEMTIPENAFDGRWIIRTESGINSKNFGFVVESQYTLFQVEVSEISPSAAGYLVLIEGQYAQPETLVDISISNSDNEEIWSQQVRSNSKGEFSVLWITTIQETGALTVTANDSLNTSQTTFLLPE